MSTCWKCGKEMKEEILEFTDEIQGEQLSIKTKGLVCECGYMTVPASLMDEYNIKLADTYRKKYNLLTTEDIKGYRKLLGMSQKKFADFLDVHAQSIKRWEHGCVQDKAMDSLIRLKMNSYFDNSKIPGKVKIDLKRFETPTVNEIADHIIDICNKSGQLITNILLQKLTYYTQAWFLALYNKPLFKEEFEAWKYGPVQPELYERFKSFGYGPINFKPETKILPDNIGEHIEMIIETYSEYSPSELVEISHKEKPWKDAYLETLQNDEGIISKEEMKKYYEGKLKYRQGKEK